MRKLIRIFDEILFKKVDPIGLSVFRILYTLILLFEVLQMFNNSDLIYADSSSEIDVRFIFSFWIPSIIFLLIGYKTQLFSVLNYVFGVIIFSSSHYFEYHIFYGYVGINFLLMITSKDLSLRLSIDAIKNRKEHVKKVVIEQVFAINYILPVFVGIAIVYFDSTFFKLDSPMWLNGLGFWLPSSMPMAVWNNFSWILNNQFLSIFLGYFILIFEIVFILFFWMKRMRMIFFTIGVLFHIGIFFTYPIPFFALSVCSIYLLLVPISFWKKIFKIADEKEGIFFEEINDKKELFKKKSWKGLILLIIFFQCVATIRSPVVQNGLKKMNLKDTNLDYLFIKTYGCFGLFAKKYIGITNHTVFLEFHFKGYDRIFKLEYIDEGGNSKLLPLLNDKGMPVLTFNNGPMWRNFTFNTSSPYANSNQLERSLPIYLRHFKNKGLKFSTVNVFMKEIEVPEKWSKDFLKNQISKKWVKAGFIRVENNKCYFEWSDIMNKGRCLK